MNSSLSLLRVFHFLLCVLLLAACSAQPERVEFEAVSLSAFPEALGRGFPVAVAPSGGPAAVGEVAPDFAFVLADGRGISLSDLRGRPVVINFWATWCGPCRLEMPEFVALHRSHPDLVVLEVNVMESEATARPFAEEFGMTMPVILDQEGDVQRAYGVRGLPVTIFINAEGEVVSRWDGILNRTMLAERIAEL